MLDRMRVVACPLVLVAAGMTCLSPVAVAQDWWVDIHDPNCATGTGSMANPFCNIMDAVTAAASGDTIFIASGTYQENLVLDKDLVLVGTSGRALTTVDGTGNGEVVDIASGRVVEIRGLTLTNGLNGTLAAGISAWNPADLTLTHSSVAANRSTNRRTGGIAGAGSLTLVNTTVTDNYSYAGGYVYNGGIEWVGTLNIAHSHIARNVGTGINFSTGTLTLSNSTVMQNAYGGVIAASGVLSMANCTVSGNSNGYGYDGAGVLNFRSTATLTHCTISGNRTSYAYGAGVLNTGTMSMTNCTVSGNHAYDKGGGVHNEGTLALKSCSIVDNTAYYSPGGLYNQSGATVTLKNTILAENHSSAGSVRDCSGTLTSEGYNLIGSRAGCNIQGDETGNLYGVDPLIGPLEDQGGPTRTHALQAGSPAINSGHPDPAQCPVTDQRGVPREDCDIGAFERSLALDADPNRPSVGTPVNILTFHGLPGSLTLLAFVEVDATPLFQLLSFGPLDSAGERLVTGTVPAGLEGVVLVLLAHGFNEGGAVVATQRETIAIR